MKLRIVIRDCIKSVIEFVTKLGSMKINESLKFRDKKSGKNSKEHES